MACQALGQVFLGLPPLPFNPPTMALSLLRAVTVAVCGVSFLDPVFAISPGFNYGSSKVRGVNLGGWLVLEVRTFVAISFMGFR